MVWGGRKGTNLWKNLDLSERVCCSDSGGGGKDLGQDPIKRRIGKMIPRMGGRRVMTSDGPVWNKRGVKATFLWGQELDGLGMVY